MDKPHAERPLKDRDAEPISSGVKALVERLRDEGISQGRNEAEVLLADAKKQAQSIVNQARDEADKTLRDAKQAADRLQQAGAAALETAARDVVLKIKADLMQRFAQEVGQLVSRQLQDEAFLQRLILEVAGQATREADLGVSDRLEVLLPKAMVDLDDLRQHPETAKEGTLAHFVCVVSAGVLRDGVTFQTTADTIGGIRLRLVDQQIQVELTDRAITEFLLAHLQPRFRALLEGVIH